MFNRVFATKLRIFIKHFTFNTMKKLLLVLAAAFAVVACQTDLNDVRVSGNAVVTFQVQTPEVASRVYSDGASATHLQYAVYDEEGKLLNDLTVTNGEIHGSTTVELQLVTGNSYAVIFWAAAPNAPYSVDFAAKTMTVGYTNALCNDEARDAFYKLHTFTVTGSQTEVVELRRPFAQLNIGTNDYDAAQSAGYEPTLSAVTVKNVYSTLNLWNGTVDGSREVTFDYAAIPTTETFPVANYDYLSMNYLLVAADKALVEIEFGYGEAKATPKTRIVGSVPVQRNYRTNIFGQLFTSDVDFNVIIVPDYEDPDYNVKTTIVNSVDELGLVLADAEAGSTVVLSNQVVGDIALEEVKDVTIDAYLTNAVRFVTSANTKLENVTIKNIDFDFVTGKNQKQGACVVIDAAADINNLVIEDSNFEGDGKKNSYGIVGQNPNATITVKNCTFSNLGYAIQTITGGGYALLVVEGCTFLNINSWVIMPQYGYNGDLTVNNCTFNSVSDGLVKTGTLSGLFTFTNNTITNSAGHDGKDSKWFDVTAANKVVSGNTKDGADWTPEAAQGLK